MLQQVIYQEAFTQSALADVDVWYVELPHERIEDGRASENDVSPLWLQAWHLAALLKGQRR
jgi:hypothetical protein